MRMLVTGAKGMLGSDLCPVMREHYEILATDIEEMDVRNRALVRKTVLYFAPQIVVHLAALTDVDECERDPDAAFRTNTIGTQHVALACQEIGADMVYVSTMGVFDGRKATPYTEFDTPNPQNVYGQSKYQGERIVQHLLPQSYIVRASWMFGGGPKDKKFVAKILDLAHVHTEILAVNDKFGSPTYTVDLAGGILRLIDSELYGLYHAVNAGGNVSRFELAGDILRCAGIMNCNVVSVSSAEFPLAAPRVRMEAARNYHMDLVGLEPMRDWRAALCEYMGRLNH